VLESFLTFVDQGFFDLSLTAKAVYLLVMVHITIVTVTVYLHRHAAHRALSLHPVLKHFFRFWVWFTTGMIARQWVAVHRKHHAVCETPEDPHSPQIVGIRKVLLEGTELYRASAADAGMVKQYSVGMPDDWIERNLYTAHSTWGIYTLLTINLSLMGISGLAVWAIQMMWIPFWAAGVINGVGHFLGYRNYECPDAAVNIVPVGLLIGGEELHNNHHTYPNSAKFSSKWWEFDLGWGYIRLFSWLGLAKVTSRGPVVSLDPNKSNVDINTAQGVVNDRFRVLSRYAQNVLKPTIEQEYADTDEAGRLLLRDAYRLLRQADVLKTDADEDRIRQIVEASSRLGAVYRLQQNLKALWQKSGHGGQALVDALDAWMKEAERCGIEKAGQFARSLRSYTLPSASAS